MNTRETVEVGKTYHVEHKTSTMAYIAEVLDVDGDTVRVSGDMHQPSYLVTMSEYRWTEQN